MKNINSILHVSMEKTLKLCSEKRKTYFFKGDNGYFVRAGCFFGTFDDFIERVHQVHAITKYEKEYELAVELAKVVLG